MAAVCGNRPSVGEGTSRTHTGGASPRNRAGTACALCALPNVAAIEISVLLIYAARPSGANPSQEIEMSIITTATPSIPLNTTAARAEGLSKFYGTGDAAVA